MNFIKKIVKVIVKSLSFFEKIYLMIIFKIFKVDCQTSYKNIRGIPFIRNSGIFIIGKNVRINSRYRNNPIGGQTFATFIIKKNASLVISQGAGISNSTIVCWDKILIGENVYIGGDCKIYDSDFHSLNYEERIIYGDKKIKSKPVEIKKGAFIGTGTIILKGVSIGERSVIGAGSVVTKNIPSDEIWAGNPCKCIKKLK